MELKSMGGESLDAPMSKSGNEQNSISVFLLVVVVDRNQKVKHRRMLKRIFFFFSFVGL